MAPALSTQGRRPANYVIGVILALGEVHMVSLAVPHTACSGIDQPIHEDKTYQGNHAHCRRGLCQRHAPGPPEAGAESSRTGALSKRGEAAVAAYQTARISPWAKTSAPRPRVAVTAGKRALGDSRPLGAAQAKKCPALDLIGGRRYQRRAESGYQRRKVIQARRIAPGSCRRYSLLFVLLIRAALWLLVLSHRFLIFFGEKGLSGPVCSSLRGLMTS